MEARSRAGAFRRRRQVEVVPARSWSITVSFDLAKFVRLKQRVEILTSAFHGASQALRDAVSRRQTIERQAGQETEGRAVYRTESRDHDGRGFVDRHYSGNGRVSDHTARDLQLAKEAEAGARKNRQQIADEREPLLGLLNNLEAFLKKERIDAKGLPAFGGTPRRHDGPTPDPKEVDTVRATITKLQRERGRVSAGHGSRDEAFRAIDEWIAEADRAAAPKVGFINGAASLELLNTFLAEPTITDNVLIDVSRRSMAREITCWLVALAPDTVRERLRGVAAHQADAAGGWGLPSQERATKIAELDRELFDLERREEELIEQLEACGFMLPRRSNADPRAVLQTTAAVSA
jgi:hypothetical protein